MTAPRLDPERFPRASRYHPAWAAAAVRGGGNPLLLTEWLTQALPLRPACGCWTWEMCIRDSTGELRHGATRSSPATRSAADHEPIKPVPAG